MKLILDTSTKAIKEDPQEEDREKTTEQIEVDIDYVLAKAVAMQAVRRRHDRDAQKKHAEWVCKLAIAILNKL